MSKEDAIYARQSIDKTDSISVESQIEYCRYETRGNHCRIYRDKGYSGKNTDRPEFRRMLADIRNGEIGRVICYKLDRCSRSILDFANLMEEFQQYGVEFVSCTEKFDTSSPMGRAMLNICIVFAQLERETIQQRVVDAYHARFKHGFFMGGKIPLGFSSEPYYLNGKKTARYVVNEEESSILEFMYRIYQDPLSSMGDVVSALNAAGIHHPRKEDGSWSRTHIGRLLRSPAYVKADLAVYDYFRKRDTVIHNCPEDFIGTNGCYLYTDKNQTQHLVIAPHQGVISSDIWLQCVNKRKPAKGTSRQNKVKNTWLAGKLKCRKCGYAVVVQKTVKSNGTVFRYLICSKSAQGSNRCDGIHGLKADAIESLVFEEIKKRLLLFPVLTAPKETGFDPKSLQLKLRIAQLDDMIDNIVQKAMEASGALMQALSARASSLNSERRICAEKLQNYENEQPITKAVANYISMWQDLCVEDKMAVCDALIHRISLSETELKIEWKI